jgi:hypothetical protein
MNRKLILITILVLGIALAITFCKPDTPSIKTISDFDDVLAGSVPEGWLAGVETSYTGGDEDGPLVKNDAHGSDNRIFLIMQAALGGDTGDPNDLFGYSFTGYTYVQYEFTTNHAGALEFTYQSCGWHGADGMTSGVPQGTFEFWLDLDIADIETAANPDWTAPDQDLYDGETASIEISEPGTYRLTWKAVKDDVDTFEDRAALDMVRFIPEGAEGE